MLYDATCYLPSTIGFTIHCHTPSPPVENSSLEIPSNHIHHHSSFLRQPPAPVESPQWNTAYRTPSPGTHCKLSHLNITNSTILTINYIFSLHHRALYHQGNTENSLKATDEETRATDEETRAICTFYHPHNPYNLMLLKLLLLQPSPLISPIQSKSMLNNTLMEPHPLTWIS